MEKKDHFREFLGVKIVDVKDGYAKMSLQLTKNHVNALGYAHGAAIFALADCAFAEAVNFGDKVAVAIQVDINFLRPAHEGNVLTAEATRVSEGRTFGLYKVAIRKGDDLIAIFSGLAYKK